jgi:putative protein kinase ArgK-like GTPase of G3E family
MLEKMLRELAEKSSEKIKEGYSVIKTIPIRKEWRPMVKEMKDLQKQGIDAINNLESLKNKLLTKTRKFWAQVEEDIDDFDHMMEIDHDNDEIKILEEEDKDK